jgi:hypothetical protein
VLFLTEWLERGCEKLLMDAELLRNTMAPPQGFGPSPEYLEELKQIRASSQRLESWSTRLVWLTIVLAAETIVLIVMTAFGLWRR